MLRWLVLCALMLSWSSLVPVAFGQDADTSTPGQAQQNDSTSAAREAEESSSKDTRIDLAPPKDDAKNHPNSTTIITDPDDTTTASDVEEMHAWDPHKAAKDI